MWFILFLWIVCSVNVSARNLVGAYVPQRDSSGKLLPKQCHGSTGFCWCVDPDGAQIGEAAGPGIPLDCY
jgi:hypothetical protein